MHQWLCVSVRRSEGSSSEKFWSFQEGLYIKIRRKLFFWINKKIAFWWDKTNTLAASCCAARLGGEEKSAKNDGAAGWRLCCSSTFVVTLSCVSGCCFNARNSFDYCATANKTKLLLCVCVCVVRFSGCFFMCRCIGIFALMRNNEPWGDNAGKQKEQAGDYYYYRCRIALGGFGCSKNFFFCRFYGVFEVFQTLQVSPRVKFPGWWLLCPRFTNFPQFYFYGFFFFIDNSRHLVEIER